MSRVEQLLRDFSEASRQSGRSVAALLVEMTRLRFALGRMGASEYLDFRLHMNDLSYAQKCAFGGYRAEAVLEEILIDDYARFLSLDKISMYFLLASFNLPVPRIHAVYRSKRPAALKCIATPEALAEYLTTEAPLPLYLKPSFGSYGRGNLLIQGRDASGQLLLGDGSRIDVASFCNALDERGGLGWILQEPLQSHSEIARLCGPKISGVRVHTFMSNDGPVLTKAIWKINVGTEDSDNFRDGLSGNLAAPLDIDNGKVSRVVSGIGLEQQINIRHPRTGADLLGFTVPYWAEIKALVCDAHLAFPGFLCPGWDLAVCEDGPKILEINYFGDIDLSQRAYHLGFLDERFLALMRQRGLEHLLCGGSQKRKRSPVTGRYGVRKHHWKW